MNKLVFSLTIRWDYRDSRFYHTGFKLAVKRCNPNTSGVSQLHTGGVCRATDHEGLARK